MNLNDHFAYVKHLISNTFTPSSSWRSVAGTHHASSAGFTFWGQTLKSFEISCSSPRKGENLASFINFKKKNIFHTQPRSSGFQQDSRLRLVGEEFRIKRLRDLQGIIRRRVSLEEDHLKKQQQELLTLLYAEEQGGGCNSLDPQVALALARASRDVLTAEEEVAKLRILECEQLLETLKDAADDAHARAEDANCQIGQILSFFDHQQIQVDLRKRTFQPSSPHFTNCCAYLPSIPSIPSIPSPASSSTQSATNSDLGSDASGGPCTS